MNNQSLGIHEKAELHEMLAFKTCCVTKSQAMQSVAQDQELRSLLQQDVQTGQSNIQDLQRLLNQGTAPRTPQQ